MSEPAWWAQRRFGLLVHGSIASVPAWAPVGQYSDWYAAHLGEAVRDVRMHPTPMVETLAHHRDRWAHIESMDDFLPLLTFDDFDADEWTTLARDAGMGTLVMVAKHHDGLCWWDAPGTDRTVIESGPRRNVLAEMAAACERADLMFGTYYSLLDWADARYPSARFVDEVVHPQVLDLVGRYGSRLLWGDGHWGGGGSHWRSDELIAAARRIDPELVVNDRWWSDGSGVRSYEYRLPGGVVDEPWELRRGLGGSFSWNRAERPDHLMSPSEIVALLTEVVAKGGHLLLSVGPDAHGAIPADHADRLRAAGGWVRRHRDLVERALPWPTARSADARPGSAGPTWGDDDCRYLVLDDQLHVVDVSGRGRFAALTPDVGRIRSVETLDGVQVEVDTGATGTALRRTTRKSDRLPQVYRVVVEPHHDRPIELFPSVASDPVELATLLAGARRGSIVQLGDGTYSGPAEIPEGVTLRGLGPGRTTIATDGGAVSLATGARLEHCRVRSGGSRIAWLPTVVVRVRGAGATVLGCDLSGHIEVAGDEARVVSCTGNGVLVRGADRAAIVRCHFAGMGWDWAVEIEGGNGHVVESCEFERLLGAIRIEQSIATTVRGNRCATRWWGVLAVDTESTTVTANSFERVLRSIDLDGGAGAEVVGNASNGGDSGCVVQGGATSVSVSGNRWERTRIGLLTWGAGDVRHHDNDCADLGEPDGAHVTDVS